MARKSKPKSGPLNYVAYDLTRDAPRVLYIDKGMADMMRGSPLTRVELRKRFRVRSYPTIKFFVSVLTSRPTSSKSLGHSVCSGTMSV